ncbi:MAG TPA: HEAT repeat domain-containing protein [Longimicrobiaceae bacterium]
MIDPELLARVLGVLGAAFAGALLLIFGHGLQLAARRRWSAPRLARGRAVLHALMDGTAVPPEEMRALRALPVRLRVRLVVELASSVAGTQRTRLSRLAEEMGLTQSAERLCRSRLWWRRLRGIRLLAAVDAGVDAVPPLLDDPHPVVRADAAEWAAAHPGPAVLGRLLAHLDDPSSLARFSVQDSLLRMGAAASEPLLRHLETRSGEDARPALEVAAGLADVRFFPVAVRLCGDADPAVRACAAELVGAIGGGEGTELLAALLDDPDAGVRAAATRALGALRHWPAASGLALRLRDSAWIVRREAGLALRAVGSPGLLFLRRALDDPDPFAADMARQVLDLPGDAAADTAR